MIITLLNMLCWLNYFYIYTLQFVGLEKHHWKKYDSTLGSYSKLVKVTKDSPLTTTGLVCQLLYAETSVHKNFI